MPPFATESALVRLSVPALSVPVKVEDAFDIKPLVNPMRVEVELSNADGVNGKAEARAAGVT